VADTDVSIERVNLALYDSYVVTGPYCGLKPDVFVGLHHSYCGPLQLWCPLRPHLRTTEGQLL